MENRVINRRRSILKNISNNSTEIEINEIQLNAETNNEKENTESIYKLKRRVSFGSSYIKEFLDSANFEDVENCDLLWDKKKTKNNGDKTCVNEMDMDVCNSNFNETYVVVDEGKKENVKVFRSREQDVIFCITPKHLMNGLLNNGNILNKNIRGRPSIDMTFIADIDMDISKCDDSFFIPSSTMLPFTTTTMDLSIGCDDSYLQSENLHPIIPFINRNKTAYGGDMSLCLQNATFTWTKPSSSTSNNIMKSSTLEHSSFKQDTDEGITFVVGRDECIKNVNHSSFSCSTTSFVECLDDQVQPTLLFGIDTVNDTALSLSLSSSSEENDDDSILQVLNSNFFNLSPDLKRFIQFNNKMCWVEKIEFMDKIMDELINMTPEIYEEFCKHYSLCFRPKYLEAIQIHRRCKKAMQEIFDSRARRCSS